MIKFVVLALAVTMVSCQYDRAPAYGYHSEGHDEYAEPHYNFEYSVYDPHTKDIKWHKEQRKGDHTQGEYYLVEPDGSKRNVQYHVEGKSGFIAEVHREAGKGGYEHPSYPKPSYKPPSYY